MTSGGPSVSDLEPRRRVPHQDPTSLEPDRAWTNSVPLRVLMLYDMDACHGPTGVTRHALAQLERLSHRPDVALATGLGPDDPPGRAGLLVVARRPAAAGAADPDPRPLAVVADQALAADRLDAGPADWVYCPAEYSIPARQARRAVTSHDVLQHLRFQPAKNRELLATAFRKADLILSVSHFNTQQLLEAFPWCEGRVAHVPNAADDLFFEPASPARARSRCGPTWGCPPGFPTSSRWRTSRRGRTCSG